MLSLKYKNTLLYFTNLGIPCIHRIKLNAFSKLNFTISIILPIIWLMPIYRHSIIFFRYIIGHYLNVHLYYAYMQCFLSRTLQPKCIGAQIVSYFENALSDFHLLSVVMSWEWANTRKWKTRFSSDFLPHLIVFRYYGDLKLHLDFFC